MNIKFDPGDYMYFFLLREIRVQSPICEKADESNLQSPENRGQCDPHSKGV